MRRFQLVIAVPLLIAVWCASTVELSAAASAPSASPAAKGTTTTAPPTTLPIERVPPTTSSGATDAAAPTGKILMVKLYVGNMDAGEKFYGNVFGAKVAIKLGANAQVVTFPNGGPGLVLLKKSAKDKNKQGAFIVQVPNLDASVALALANGAKKQGTFAGAPASQAAKSVDTLDPWGNQVEILQIG